MGSRGDSVEIRDGSIRLRFSFEGVKQQRTILTDGRPLLPTAANVKYARRLAAEIKLKIQHGIFNMAEYFPASGDGGALTVSSQLDAWLACVNAEDSTLASYKSAVRFWKATIGNTPLRALRKSHILHVLVTRKDLSGKTLNNYMIALRQALDLAVEDGTLTDDPTATIHALSYQKPPPDPFDLAEAERIMAKTAERHPGQVTNLVEFWFWTGMRTSEIFGLKWKHIDLARGEVQVSEALIRGRRKKTTKTNTERMVLLNDRARAALQRQRQHTQMKAGSVFEHPLYGEPWNDERAFRRSFWTPILTALGIRYRRPYNMRHTYATVMLMAGMTPAFCANQLGHSVEMFLRTYATKWINGERDTLEMQRLKAVTQAVSGAPTGAPTGQPGAQI